MRGQRAVGGRLWVWYPGRVRITRQIRGFLTGKCRVVRTSGLQGGAMDVRATPPRARSKRARQRARAPGALLLHSCGARSMGSGDATPRTWSGPGGSSHKGPLAGTRSHRARSGVPGCGLGRLVCFYIWGARWEERRRRRRDSNPRNGGYPLDGFQDRCNQPLCHSSECASTSILPHVGQTRTRGTKDGR